MDNSRDIAYNEYMAGLAPHEIEKKHGIKADTVRKWIKRLGWTKDTGQTKAIKKDKQDNRTGHSILPAFNVKRKTDRAGQDKLHPPPKNTPHPQARPGNQNAKGNRGPVKFNIYSTIKPENLPPGDKRGFALHGEISDRIAELEKQSRLIDLKIIDLWDMIGEWERAEDGLVLMETDKKKGKDRGQGTNYRQQKGVNSSIPIDKAIGRIAELTRTKERLIARIEEMDIRRQALPQLEVQPEINALAELSLDELRRLLQLAE